MVSSWQFVAWPCGSDTGENEPHGISGSDSQEGNETIDSSLENAPFEYCTINLSAHKNNYNSSFIENVGRGERSINALLRHYFFKLDEAFLTNQQILFKGI